jgi:integrase
MANPKRPPRLWLDKGLGTWCILYDRRKIRTGVRAGDLGAAQRSLERFLTDQRSTPEAPAKNRRAEQIYAAEVLDRYLKKKADVARPKELGQRVEALLDFWGEMTLDEIDEDTCAAFCDEIGSPSYGRRCLEDFRAAVNDYAKAGYLRDMVLFTLPAKPSGRTDWLTWEEIKALCRTAWTYTESQVRETRDGPRRVETSKHTTRHIVKFIMTAVVTCSRSARIYDASYVAEQGRPFVNLKTGRYFRSWADEVVAANKQAPTIPIGSRLLKAMKRWHAGGDTYVVEYNGGPANPKKAFNSTVERARKAHPKLFKRDDGTEKQILRHTLRHTGITWLALQGVDVYEICNFAGLTKETFERVYAHHHPAYMTGVMKVQGKNQRKQEKAPA